MPKIITVTLNTAIDALNVISMEGQVQPAADFPAGKGINVARTVRMLGSRVLALGFVGESEKPLFEQLEDSLLKVRLTPVAGITRTNQTTYDRGASSTTHDRSVGFSVTQADFDEILALLTNTVEQGDIVVLSGSLPPGAPISTYRDMVLVCHDAHATVILDSSNEELDWGIRARPFMIKPNVEELGILVGQELDQGSDRALIQAAVSVIAKGPRLVVVSRGDCGVIVVEAGSLTAWKALVALDAPPAATGGVGSGDALVGAFAAGLMNQQPLVDIIRLGVACGAANVLSIGPGICRRDDVDRLMPRVTIASVPIP